MLKKSKVLSMLVVLAVISTIGVTTASARLINQISLGGGVKCYAVPVTQPDGTVVYQQICRKGV